MATMASEVLDAMFTELLIARLEHEAMKAEVKAAREFDQMHVEPLRVMRFDFLQRLRLAFDRLRLHIATQSEGSKLARNRSPIKNANWSQSA